MMGGTRGFWLGLLAVTMSLRGEGFVTMEPVAAGVGLGTVLTESEPFRVAELHAVWSLGEAIGGPWRSEAGIQWGTGTGMLHASQITTWFVRAGPIIFCRHRSSSLQLAVGIAPTLLSRENPGRKRMGSNLQFTSSMEIGWGWSRRWEVGYRVEHLSNGSLSQPNPGLNLQYLRVSRRF